MVKLPLSKRCSWKRGVSLPVKDSGKIIVERAGYIPPRLQIAQMIRTGQRIQEHRENMVDTYEDDLPDDVSIPSRSPNYDLVDAGRDFQRGQEIMEQVIKDQEEKLNEERNRKRSSSDSEVGESVDPTQEEELKP